MALADEQIVACARCLHKRPGGFHSGRLAFIAISRRSRVEPIPSERLSPGRAAFRLPAVRLIARSQRARFGSSSTSLHNKTHNICSSARKEHKFHVSFAEISSLKRTAAKAGAFREFTLQAKRVDLLLLLTCRAYLFARLEEAQQVDIARQND